MKGWQQRPGSRDGSNGGGDGGNGGSCDRGGCDGTDEDVAVMRMAVMGVRVMVGVRWGSDGVTVKMLMMLVR